MRAIALGTAGGPLWRAARGGPRRAGIATAVVVDGFVYLIDCGWGVGERYVQAGLRFPDLAGIFLTHMHSDHTIDLNSVMVMGGLAFRSRREAIVPVLGPGPRGSVPRMNEHASEELSVVFPDNPTPGTREMVELLLRAHATDLNDRRRDSLGADPTAVFRARDIVLPEGIGYDADERPHPPTEPFEVFRDSRVSVTATLVQHAPVAPAFAFRFESRHGSVVVSGDTGPSANLERLARGADVLFHEAIDLAAVEALHAHAAPDHVAASMRHHRHAHTTPEAAGQLAERAGVRVLALHHLVPAGAPPTTWGLAARHFRGELRVLEDLDTVHVTPPAPRTARD
ncbi:MBL fold metallo-hydrolase [Sinomonas soli]